MNRKRQQSHSVDFLFTLVTFLIYASAMIMLVYMGTAVYRSVTQQMEQHYATRTAQAYITEKIRQNDKSGSIFAEQVDGHQVLTFLESVDGRDYVTYIYEDEGKLKELFTRKDSEISLSGGTEILDLQGFSVEEPEDGCFRISITDADGKTREFVIYQDSEEQGGR